jgi:hypothetical protein
VGHDATEPKREMSENIRREAELLAGIEDRLADLTIDLLARGIEGDAAAVRLEREVQRARRSVAKAGEILRSVTDDRVD